MTEAELTDRRSPEPHGHRPVRMAVIGVGHFGRFHAQKLAASPYAALACVYDTDPARAAAVAQECDTRAAASLDEALSQAEAVSIAVPTRRHAAVATAALEAGRHVLIEKPITETPAEAQALIDLAARSGRVLQVGHLIRFAAPIARLRAEISQALYVECVRIAPWTARGTDVNVILDLMIHDLDLVLSIVPAPIADIDAVGTPVLSEREDIANARVKFADGCVATITASRVSMKTERKLRVFEADRYTSIDFGARQVRRVRRTGAVSKGGIPDLDVSFDDFAETDLLAEELSAFLAAVRGERPPEVTGREGLRALEAAIAVNESLRRHAAFVAERTGLVPGTTNRVSA
ncbi:Gfo/Idh/MocA family protein [Marinibaculum pumilum]|uniref:Gfo/Idh/MocA family protein n=1 Tax=Marinibaculum pumilum TaxID=1766165 RepID=A0ABV7L542_9PROT